MRKLLEVVNLTRVVVQKYGSKGLKKFKGLHFQISYNRPGLIQNKSDNTTKNLKVYSVVLTEEAIGKLKKLQLVQNSPSL